MRTASWLLPLLAFWTLVTALGGALPRAEAKCPPSFRGPGGAVPPGLREPADPPPTEPPTTPPGTQPPPTTPPPTTPGAAPATPPTTPAPTTPRPSTPDTGPGRREQGRDDTTWETWWELCKIEFFPRRFVAPTLTGDGPISALPSALDAETVREKLWPALMKGAQEREESVQEAAIIALARVAASPEQKAVARELLTTAMGDPAHDGAHSAAIGLSYVADGTSIYPLFLAAREKKVHDDVRAYVALTMTTIGHPMAAGLLRQLADVRGGYYELVAAALMALGYTSDVHDPWIPEFLEKIVDDPKLRVEFRAVAAESFGRLGRVPTGLPVLLRALADKDAEVRRSAAIAIGVLDWRTQAERDIAAIREEYAKWVNKPMSPEDATKIAAFEAQIPAQREAMDVHARAAVKALAQALEKDGDSFTRNMCVISLGRLARTTGSELAIKTIEKDLKRDRVVIREYDVLALAIARAESAHAAAVEAITGKNKADTTRAAGCVALGLLGDPKGDPVLTQALQADPHPFVRGYAALALGMIGTPTSADVILPLVRTTRTPTARAYGALGLGLLGTKRASEVLTGLLESEEIRNPIVMSHVVYALGLTKDRTRLERLVELAVDTANEGALRRAAYTAIGYISSQEFFPRRHLMARGHNYLLELSYLGSYFYTL